jgi:hypothetical protein
MTAKKRHKTARSGRRTRLSPKRKLLGAIRRLKEAAVILRLSGKVAGAMRYEEDLGRRVKEAATKGWATAAFTAEDEGSRRGYHAHGKKY